MKNYDLADVLRQPDTKQARHLLRYGEGESFAVPLKIRATGFAGLFIRARLAANSKGVLLDVREDNEWQAGHAAEAVHLGKGILERDLEKLFPDPKTEIIMYCGGGFRSALTADAAQKMGYRNVHSLIGGYKGMMAAGWPMKSGAQ